MEINTLYEGDNVDILRELSAKHPQGFIDLIYIDPPFNSGKDYHILFQDMLEHKENGKKHPSQKKAFKDRWNRVEISQELEALKRLENKQLYTFLERNRDIFTHAQMSYLTMMAIRLYHMHRVLKDTGSFYLHSDPTMSHYLKLLCDILFGVKNFRNEIIWHYTGGGRSKRYFSRKHDVILFYVKDALKHPYFAVDAIRIPYKDTSGYAKSGIQSKKGKHYMPHPAGTPVDDVWDVPMINPLAKERLGYPTQKPTTLLERIIQASSGPGDLVADFFCGSGTTLAVAARLGRRWLGVDNNSDAIAMAKKRILAIQKMPHDDKDRAPI